MSVFSPMWRNPPTGRKFKSEKYSSEDLPWYIQTNLSFFSVKNFGKGLIIQYFSIFLELHPFRDILSFCHVSPGWDETNFLGRDRDREIRLIKIHYETETEKKWMLIFWTRRDRDETVWFFYVRDETETRLNSKFQARPRRDRESRCLFSRDRDENQLLMKKYTVYLANFCYKLLIQIRTRPRRD